MGQYNPHTSSMDKDDDVRNEASCSAIPAVVVLDPSPSAAEEAGAQPPHAPPPISSSPTPPLQQQQYLGDGTPIPPHMSKNAYKKMLKKQSWEASKGDRRAREKEKKRDKKAILRERKAEEVAAAAAAGNGEEESLIGYSEPRKKRKMFKGRVVIDMGFDELMSDKEITSMTSQIAFLYSSNRRSHAPFSQIIIAGPSRTSALEYCPNPTSTSEQWAPHETAKLDGFYSKLQEAIAKGDTVEMNESRIGKLMQATGDAQWRRWKNVAIVEKGGMETLWEGGTQQEGRTGGGGEEEEESNDHKGAKAESMNAVEAEAKEVPPLSEASPLDGKKPSHTRRSRQRRASFVHPSTIVPTNLNKEDVIYLTADTDETIEELQEGKTYVIGGIVDRNRYKHLCLNKAQKLGLKVARLPIDVSNLTKKSAEGKVLSARKVLTVNQVFDILIGWTEQYQQEEEERAGDEEKGQEVHQKWKRPSWEEALERGLPGRKFIQKDAKSNEEGEMGSSSEQMVEKAEEDGVDEGLPDSKRPRMDK